MKPIFYSSLAVRVPLSISTALVSIRDYKFFPHIPFFRESEYHLATVSSNSHSCPEIPPPCSCPAEEVQATTWKGPYNDSINLSVLVRFLLVAVQKNSRSSLNS